MPWVAGSAVVGSLVGGYVSSKATGKAVDVATQAQQQNSRDARETYERNVGYLSPYIQAGYGATNQLMSHLGIAPAGAQAGLPGAGPYGGGAGASAGGYDWNAYLQNNPDVAAQYQQVNGPGLAQALGLSNDPQAALSPEQFAAYHFQQFGQGEGRPAPTLSAAGGAAGAGASGGQSQATSPIWGPDVGERPTFTRPDAMARPDLGPLDVSLGAYQQSPDFQFQMDRGIGAITSNKALNGLLHSGDALKGTLDFSQNLAMGDYGQWRDFTASRYDADRARQDALFNLDRSRGDQIFADDRAYGTGVYDADRNYATGRFDQYTNALMGVSNQGLSGANALAGVGTSYVNNMANSNNAMASTVGNAAIQNSNTINGLLGDAVGAYAYARGGQRKSSYGA